MTEPLTLARFRALADAYGGVVARWPAAERAAAERLAREAEGAKILRTAIDLDQELDEWQVPAPSDALVARIVAQAPMPSRQRWRHARWWWSGIGVAAALAGASAGAAAVTLVAPAEAGGTTSFGDVPGVEGNG